MIDELINIDRVFEKLVLIDGKIANREFDGCTFKNCDFSNSALRDCVFIDCQFVGCNLSMVKFTGSGLKTVHFKDCKMLGIRFDEADDFLFSTRFLDCVVDYSWFVRKKMAKTEFAGCSLKGVNFSNADLTSAIFDRCNLEGAVFDSTLLKTADFTTSYNYTIDPEFNPMQKAKFSVAGIPGLLGKYDIKIE